MIELSNLKLRDIRNIFDVDINGEIKEITIFNMIGDTRSNFIQKLTDLSKLGVDGEDLIDSIYTDLFMECTNVVLDDDIKDVLNAPSSDMLLVLNEVLEILHELQIEQLLQQNMLLNDLVKASYLQNTILKTEKAQIIQEINQKLEKEIKDLNKQLEGE